jgi:hypothetical protein
MWNFFSGKLGDSIVVGLVTAAVVAAVQGPLSFFRRFKRAMGGNQALVTIRYAVAHRSTKVRFSASAILLLESNEEDGRYLLCRSHGHATHATWGPLGGVIKCTRAKTEQPFRKWKVEYHRTSNKDLDHEMLADLRVIMPIWKFRHFLKWFLEDQGRESPTTTLIRELQEELLEQEKEFVETKMHKDFSNDLNALLPSLSLDYVEEGLPVTAVREKLPDEFPGEHLIHIRLFYVLRPNEPAEFLTLIERAKSQGFGQELRWASADEIREGKFSGEPEKTLSIGMHSGALLGEINPQHWISIYNPRISN